MKHLYVPKYETLTIKELLSEAEKDDNVMKYLPSIRKEIYRMPKSYLVSVIYTVIGDNFKAWVNARIDQRNTERSEKRDDMVEVTQDFKDAVERTT